MVKISLAEAFQHYSIAELAQKSV